MQEIWFSAFTSVVLVSLISLIGLATFAVSIKHLHKALIFMVSFAAGGLFGDAFIHLLPKIVEEQGFSLSIALFVLLGIVMFFIVEKIIHWKHCHQHHHHHLHNDEKTHRDHLHPFAWMNLLGDAVHNFIDGIIIGASYLASIPVGIATTIAVAMHEIPQEIGDFAVLLKGGFSKRKALMFNFFSALTALFGLIIVFSLNNLVRKINLFVIPFAVGGFIYIAGSDLIPEIHKEVKIKNSLMSLGCFVLGIAVMVALLALE